MEWNLIKWKSEFKILNENMNTYLYINFLKEKNNEINRICGKDIF